MCYVSKNNNTVRCANEKSKKSVEDKKGPLQGGRAWSRGSKSAVFEILQYKDHYL